MAGKAGSGAGGGAAKKLAMAAVLVVGVAGGVKGFVLPGGTPAGAGEPATTTTRPLGPVVSLDPITLNIDGGRFLKVGLAFQLPHDHQADGHKRDSDDPTRGYARALDVAIDVLGGGRFEDLVTPDGRRRAKEELAHALEEAYPDEIKGVYFYDFVMQ